MPAVGRDQICALPFATHPLCYQGLFGITPVWWGGRECQCGTACDHPTLPCVLCCNVCLTLSCRALPAAAAAACWPAPAPLQSSIPAGSRRPLPPAGLSRGAEGFLTLQDVQLALLQLPWAGSLGSGAEQAALASEGSDCASPWPSTQRLWCEHPGAAGWGAGTCEILGCVSLSPCVFCADGLNWGEVGACSSWYGVLWESPGSELLPGWAGLALGSLRCAWYTSGDLHTHSQLQH